MWDFTIFLDVDFDITLKRDIKRTLEKNKNASIDEISKKFNERYKPGQKIYLNTKPKQKATIVINNNDYNNPKKIIF